MLIFKKIIKLIKHPLLIIDYLLKRNKYQPKKIFAWQPDCKNKLMIKQYNNYNEYVDHQKLKFRKMNKEWIKSYDNTYREILKNRLKGNEFINPSMNVLCLAARVGTEVKSFIDLNYFAVGIDLEPGKNNKYVVHGDFHKIQYNDNTVDVVFINSLDHSCNLGKLISEVKRVLKTNGVFLTEIGDGSKVDGISSNYEAVSWEKNDDLLNMIVNGGFEIARRKIFNEPWKGESVLFKLKK